MGERLDKVLVAIDAANRADPKSEPDEQGREHPATYLYGLRMSRELERLFDAAGDVLRIAARGQHIERWRIKRADYPKGRTGYLTWRRDLGRFHGERLAGLMEAAGYQADDCARVGVLLRKEGLKRDAEVQQLEDVICMTFLRWYFAPFAAKHSEEKIANIVARTARKMSPGMRARVLVEFDLPDGLAEAFAPEG